MSRELSSSSWMLDVRCQHGSKMLFSSCVDDVWRFPNRFWDVLALARFSLTYYPLMWRENLETCLLVLILKNYEIYEIGIAFQKFRSFFWLDSIPIACLVVTWSPSTVRPTHCLIFRFVYARIDRPAGTIKFGAFGRIWLLNSVAARIQMVKWPNHP